MTATSFEERINSAEEVLPAGAAPNDDLDEEAIPPAFSDDALALRFAEQHASDLRFVAAWGKWLHWIGTHWAMDETLSVWWQASSASRPNGATNQGRPAATTSPWAVGVRSARRSRMPRLSSEL